MSEYEICILLNASYVTWRPVKNAFSPRSNELSMAKNTFSAQNDMLKLLKKKSKDTTIKPKKNNSQLILLFPHA
ncbi:MAG: hypothetical protein QG670_2720 [Thermoproteota archaeon]|nr:hypothetical protein [Thermoproteota archaeon]